MPSAVAVSAKCSYARPTSYQLAGSLRAPTKTATAADERSCFAYRSFSDFSRKNKLNSGPPIQGGEVGVPDDRAANPSPVEIAWESSKRIQCFNSDMKAGSRICALF